MRAETLTLSGNFGTDSRRRNRGQMEQQDGDAVKRKLPWKEIIQVGVGVVALFATWFVGYRGYLVRSTSEQVAFTTTVKDELEQHSATIKSQEAAIADLKQIVLDKSAECRRISDENEHLRKENLDLRRRIDEVGVANTNLNGLVVLLQHRVDELSKGKPQGRNSTSAEGGARPSPADIVRGNHREGMLRP